MGFWRKHQSRSMEVWALLLSDFYAETRMGIGLMVIIGSYEPAGWIDKLGKLTCGTWSINALKQRL